MKNAIKPLLIFAVMIGLLGGMFYFLHISSAIPENPPQTIGNTPSNLYNSGLFCEADDGRVYFSNPYDGGSLYSMTPDETDMKKLNKYNSKWINAGGDYLYYYQSADGSAAIAGYRGQVVGIYRQKKDKNKTKCLDRTSSGTLVLAGSNLYYQHYTNSGAEGMTIYKMSIDKKEYGMLADEIIDPSCVCNGYIYYAGVYGDHNLYRMDLNSGNGTRVYEGNVWNPVMSRGGDTFYFMNVSDDYRIYSASISSGEEVRLTDERADCFNLAGGYIYYQVNTGDTPALMRCTLDGSDSEIVAEGNFTDINSTSRYVYFRRFGEDGAMFKTPVSGPAMMTEFSNARSAAAELSGE